MGKHTDIFIFIHLFFYFLPSFLLKKIKAMDTEQR